MEIDVDFDEVLRLERELPPLSQEWIDRCREIAYEMDRQWLEDWLMEYGHA